MNCEDVQTRLPEYWAESIAVSAHREIEQHLQGCGACRAEAETLGKHWTNLGGILVGEDLGAAVRTRFYDMLDAYRGGLEEKPTQRFEWHWTFAAAGAGAFAMLAVGFFVGRGAAVPVAAKPDAQIAQLRGEVSSMRQMMALSLLQQQSAADRMRGVSYAYQVDKSDANVVEALLETVKSDPSVNVRLAAVDAFRNFGSNLPARRSLLAAVKSQDSPLVQIGIIELLVDLNDQTSTKDLGKLAQDASLPKEVRQRASWAVTQLK